MQKVTLWILFAGLIVACNVGIASAGEFGHYMPGVASIRDFAVPEAPGFYYAQYNLYYTTDTYNDRNGKSVKSINVGPSTLNIDTDLDIFAIQPTFAWVSDKKFLGARYATYAGIPIVSLSLQAAVSTTTRNGVEIDDSVWGLSDIYLKPVWLGWNSKHFSVSAGYGLYIPTGEYKDGAVDNLGLGFWTHELQTGVTWYPWEHQGSAVMINGIYEIHSEKDDVNITPGERLSLDYGVSQYLPINKAGTMLAELGLCGYSHWQVSKDSGSDVAAELAYKDEVHGIGGQVGLVSLDIGGLLVFRYVKEYDAKARIEGDVFTLTFAKGF